MKYFLLYYFLGGMIIFTCTVAAAEEISLTVDDAVAIALRDNRDILLNAEDLKKAQAKLAEANAGLFPTVTFTGTIAKTQGQLTKDITQTTTQMTARQYLYRGGKIINTIRYNEQGISIAQAIMDKTRLETALAVKKAFYTLILAQKLARLNDGIIKNTAEHFAVAQARFKNGEASHSDVLAISSSLDAVTEIYQNSLNQVEANRIALATLLALNTSITITPLGDFVYTPREVAIEEALLEALKQRPEIKQYLAQESAAVGSVGIAKADARPSVYASWDYYSRSHLATTTTRNWNDYNVLGLTVSWPIFDGWTTQAKVEQALADVKTAQLLQKKAASDIAAELKDAYLALRDAIAKLTTVESDLTVYGDNLTTAQQKYNEGIVSRIDVDDAQLKSDIAHFNKKQAIYDYIIAKSAFDKAKGGF